MNYISTKQLRLLFPQIRADLARGEEYVLIHRSKPIAKLVPLEKGTAQREEASVLSSPSEDDTHVTSHILHKPLTLPVPAGYSHPVAFKHLKIDLKETVELVRPAKVL